MALRTLEKGAEKLTGMYPKFDSIGDYVEGNFYELSTDDFDNERIVLWVGVDDETGENKYQWLPAAADLRKYYSQLQQGMWIKISLKKIIPSNNEQYNDKQIFLVQADEELDVVFSEGDDEE